MHYLKTAVLMCLTVSLALLSKAMTCEPQMLHDGRPKLKPHPANSMDATMLPMEYYYTGIDYYISEDFDFYQFSTSLEVQMMKPVGSVTYAYIGFATHSGEGVAVGVMADSSGLYYYYYKQYWIIPGIWMDSFKETTPLTSRFVFLRIRMFDSCWVVDVLANGWPELSGVITEVDLDVDYVFMGTSNYVNNNKVYVVFEGAVVYSEEYSEAIPLGEPRDGFETVVFEAPPYELTVLRPEWYYSWIQIQGNAPSIFNFGRGAREARIR